MGQNDQSLGRDPTRLCPVCRMPISILATRCRFCGAEVGRPRKEQETLTVKDLGGEQRSSYTLSDNVTEALEAFISEERAQLESKERKRQAAAHKSFLRRKTSDALQPPASGNTTPGLPELNAAGRDLADTTPISTRPKHNRTQQGTLLEIVGKKTLVAAALIAGLILLYFSTDFAWARLRNYINSRTSEGEFVYRNRAEELYATHTPLVEVLEEALTALRYNDTEANRNIAEKMRKRFIEEIEEKAFSAPFDMEKLSTAAQDITRAGAIDLDPRISRLLEEIAQEVGCFKFILTQIDADAKTALFRLNNPFVTEKEATVSVGDIFQDRFLVKSITSREVLLEDISKRGAGRLLIAQRLAPVAPLR